MIVEQPGFWLAVLQIIWIDILLSGDNAVVIALACRKLPPKQRVWGVVLGTVVAISLRVVFAGLVTTLMQMAYLKLVGGTLLLWIAVKLLAPEENGKSGEIQAVDYSVARGPDRGHRRRGHEPRQCHRHRRGGRAIRSAAQLCAA